MLFPNYKIFSETIEIMSSVYKLFFWKSPCHHEEILLTIYIHTHTYTNIHICAIYMQCEANCGVDLVF
jgi:hypothetical protein